MKASMFLLVFCAASPGLVASRVSSSDLPLDDAVPQFSSSAFERHVHRADLKLLRERETQERLQRTQEQRERAREKIAKTMPKISQLEALTKEEIELYATQADQPWLRRALSSSAMAFASPGATYEPWQQAYRTLGGFIDCDHTKYSSNDRHNYGYTNNGNACARWMMWASYVDPNYQGNGYNEYHGNNPTGTLDCHNVNTEWELLGVYRQEFYQYIEQISKHLWAVSDYNYVVALAGLAYMTDADCLYVGKTDDGKTIWAGVAPKPKGKFEMALYTDDYCLTPDDTLGITYDHFNKQTQYGGNNNKNNNQNNQNNNQNNNNNDYNTWWYNAQEYSLTLLNDVYEPFKYCTSCMDYPTYQDGYFIGDYGTDEDDLINQCWKFYSHYSYTCESDCIARGHAQGGLVSIKYGDEIFGSAFSSSALENTPAPAPPRVLPETRSSKIAANIFVGVSAGVFVLVFLFSLYAKKHNDRLLKGKLLDKETMKHELKRIRTERSEREATQSSSGGVVAKVREALPWSKRSRSRRAEAAAVAALYEPPVVAGEEGGDVNLTKPMD